MSRFLGTLLAIVLCLLTGEVYAQSPPAGAVSRSTLQGNITTQFPDNGVGAITPLVLRTFLDQFSNSTFFWDSDVVPSANGGTGVNNGSFTLTLAGNLTTTGAFNTTFAQAATTTITLPATSATMARTDAGQTFTGTQVFGALTATSLNGLTLSTTTGTFTLTNAKTLAVTNSLTLSGTDSTTMTFPTTSATIARTDAGQTFVGTQVIPTLTISSIPTSAGAGGLYVCVDTSGVTYKKASCP